MAVLRPISVVLCTHSGQFMKGRLWSVKLGSMFNYMHLSLKMIAFALKYDRASKIT